MYNYDSVHFRVSERILVSRQNERKFTQGISHLKLQHAPICQAARELRRARSLVVFKQSTLQDIWLLHKKWTVLQKGRFAWSEPNGNWKEQHLLNNAESSTYQRSVSRVFRHLDQHCEVGKNVITSLCFILEVLHQFFILIAYNIHLWFSDAIHRRLRPSFHQIYTTLNYRHIFFFGTLHI